MRFLSASFVALLSFVKLATAAEVDPKVLNACPGYRATRVRASGSSLTAELQLAGAACNVFGEDIPKLNLNVVYETADRIHVKITDASNERYEVPEEVFPRPTSRGVNPRSANIQFEYTTSPFTFTIKRRNGETLFTTKGSPLIFEPQYLRLKTSLPSNPNIYGLGEHTFPFRIPPDNTTLTMWNRDSYGVPVGSNLYGAHPVYYEHRSSGTHGVFLLNSNGMDIKLRKERSGASLEYNLIGGVLDFYFLAGSTSDPAAVTKQYAELTGLPAEVPYWSFGFQQCRYGYKDSVDVANVISSYAAADIPLEVMWTDIDYMDRRLIFTVEPDYFPMDRVREIVKYLHDHDQKYIVMTDPAVALITEGYDAYTKGKQYDIYLKTANGTDEIGIVWPGPAVFPDWFHPNTQTYWTEQFQSFYSPEAGIDIDGVWIDMNEPANFCDLPCTDPWAQSVEQDLPPKRLNPPPARDAPIFTNSSSSLLARRAEVDILNPPYAINNSAATGALSSKTAAVDDIHYNGLLEYDVHNLYGTMMSTATRHAMLARRPTKKPFIITRSTFPGAGAHVGKWLGDNLSLWEHYRFSIAGMLGYAGVYQVPMVGSDICGFGGNTTETLCARWATLGSFYPFMRNHNGDTSISQEFYLWPTVTEAAKNGISMRYRLLDYIYTAFHQSSLDGSPLLNPLFFKYPKDSRTFGVDLQFFYGDSILVSPVTEENSTSVTIYLPRDRFYDFKTYAPVQGQGRSVRLDNIAYTDIPVHIKGGSILPLRAHSAKTTAELRKVDFEIVVAPDASGRASGSLYVDDGESLVVSEKTEVVFGYRNGKLDVKGTFGYDLGVNVASVKFLGVDSKPRRVRVDGKAVSEDKVVYDAKNKVVSVVVGSKFERGFSVQI